MPQLPVWFDPYLYATLVELDFRPKECIAPRLKGGRCTIATKDQYEDARELRVQIEALPIGDERDELISEFLLLCCCTKWHRDKLRTHMGCFRSLVAIYGEMLGNVEVEENMVEGDGQEIENFVDRFEAMSMRTEETISLPLIDIVSDSQSIQTSTSTTNVLLTTTSTQQDIITLSQSSGISLRSGTILNPTTTTTSTTTVTLQWYQKPTPYFIPYTSLPTDSIFFDLNLSIPMDHPQIGYIYTFTWPQHPEYTKLGFTAYSPADRVADWQTCNPGAVLSRSFPVSWPKRIERLCHLELAGSRFKIGRCRVCEKSHVEWFRLRRELVEEVIEAWVTVTESGLYTENRRLSEEWRRRVGVLGLEGEITARKLLDRVREEELQAEESEDEDDDEGVAEVLVLNSEPSSSIFNESQSEAHLSEHAETFLTEQENLMPNGHTRSNNNNILTTATPQTTPQIQTNPESDSDSDIAPTLLNHVQPNPSDDSDDWITEDELDDEETTAILDLPDAFTSLRITQNQPTRGEVGVHPDVALLTPRHRDASKGMRSDVVVDAEGVAADVGIQGDGVHEVREKANGVRDIAVSDVDLNTRTLEFLNGVGNIKPAVSRASTNISGSIPRPEGTSTINHGLQTTTDVIETNVSQPLESSSIPATPLE